MTNIKLLGFIAKEASKKIQKILNESKQKNLQQKRDFRYIGNISAIKNNEKKDVKFNYDDIANNKLLKEDLTDLILEPTENQRIMNVKGGKLMKLIECLTWPNNQDFTLINGFKIDSSFEKDFFMTHHSIISSKNLYSHLIKRYHNLQPPSELSSNEFQLIQAKKIIPTQIHIIRMIDKWTTTLKEEDCCINDEIIDDFNNFKSKAENNELKNHADELKISENKKLPGENRNKVKEEPILPKNITMNNLNQLDTLLKNDNYIFNQCIKLNKDNYHIEIIDSDIIRYVYLLKYFMTRY